MALHRGKIMCYNPLRCVAIDYGSRRLEGKVFGVYLTLT